MAKLFLSALLLIISTATFACDKFTVMTLQSDTVYSLSDVDTEPHLEGGMELLYKKWNSSAEYPPQARKHKIEGRVFLSFVIDENGNIVEPKVEKGIGAGCDEAAIDALLKTGVKWIPATKGGKNVKVRLFLPFVFKLD